MDEFEKWKSDYLKRNKENGWEISDLNRHDLLIDGYRAGRTRCVECNCVEKSCGLIPWICPAHGYKKP